MRYRQLPLEQITVTDRNIRKSCSEEGMAELQASIERFGLLQPVVVFETGGDSYDLVAGHRRYRACTNLGWDTIPAMVTQSEEQAGVLAQAQENLVREGIGLHDELDMIATAMQLVENAQREKVDDLDEAEALLRVAGGRNAHGGDRRSDQVNTTNLNVRDLAALIGKSHVWVSRRLALLDLPGEVLEKVQHHEPGPSENTGIGFSTAQEIARLNGQPEVQRQLADKVERERMTARQTAAAVRKIKAEPEATQAVLAAKSDDSSFDVVTSRTADRVPAKIAPTPDSDRKPAEVMLRRFSQAYQNLCIALEPGRLAKVEEAGRDTIAEVSAEVAEHACYMRALLDNFIHDWRLDEKCGWSASRAAEVASMEWKPSVVALELLDDAEEA